MFYAHIVIDSDLSTSAEMGQAMLGGKCNYRTDKSKLKTMKSRPSKVYKKPERGQPRTITRRNFVSGLVAVVV